MMRQRGLVTCLLTGASIAGAASAAPWVRDEDGWYARSLLSAETLDGAEGWRADTYGEYGLTSRMTLTAKAEAITFPSDTAFDRQAYRLTLRRRLMVHKGWAIGAEAGPIYGSTSTGLFACDGAGAEIRAGAGYSGVREGKPFHAFADLAVIAQEGGCRRTRAEFGYGADLGYNLFTGQQVWLEDGNQTADSLKTETQLGYHFRHFDAAIGYREELGGVFTERAVLVAITARR